MSTSKRTLQILRQFTMVTLLQEDIHYELILMEETKILQKLAKEIMEYMTSDDLIGSIVSSSSWENTKHKTGTVCKRIIYDGNTCNWGRIVTTCVFALEVTKKYYSINKTVVLDNEYIEEITQWIYNEIINTTWIENQSSGWDEFIRCFGGKKGVFIDYMLVYLPICLVFVVLYSLFK